ncbi:GH92 family glycosyl hydrolase [Rarobacter faecitabidus]|nr:GH92 family glycosyl hydrolase [Rarobacter faecitabidus]
MRISRRGKRSIAAISTFILGVSMMGITTPVASAAPGDTWGNSFETGEAAPLANTNYEAPDNVTGYSYVPGTLLPDVIAATASAENGTNENAPKAADGDPTTKWLANATTAWLRFEMQNPVVLKKYVMVTANDSSDRNPKNWTVQGSSDGSTWTDLESQTNQLPTTTAPFTRVEYTGLASNTTPYKFYRLNITANNGNSLIQLADWELFSDTSMPVPEQPMSVEATTGPGSGRTAKLNAGWTGVKALRYRGQHLENGDAKATNVVYDGLNLAIGDDTELSYKIFPQLIDTDLTYPATYAAIDLELSDGSTTSLASEENLVDSYGFDFGAQAYGDQKAFYGSQWNNVQVDLSGLEGKTITKILLTYDNPTGKKGTMFTGWIDDLKIAAAQPIDGSNLLNYVDTRRGSNGTTSFSRGLTQPLTAVPNGFNFVVPYTNATSQSQPYSYHRDNNSANKLTLQGIGISHVTSPWMGDRNQFTLMPIDGSSTAAPNATPSTRAQTFTHDQEVAKPDYYKVELDNSTVVEATASDHGGVFRFTNNRSGETSLRVLADKVTGDGALSIDATGKLTGWIDQGSGLSVGRSRMFVSGTFSKTPTAIGAGTNRTGSSYGSFPITSGDKTVELRWATSFISQDQADKNLAREVAGETFEDVRTAAANAWLDRLSVIDLSASSTATDAQKLQIYSDLYRLNLYPNSQFEDTSELGSTTPVYKYASPVSAQTGSATTTQTNAAIKDGKIYVNNGFWDTYRTAWPLYSFLYPDIAEELVSGFVQQYRDAGWISRWSSPGYADLMTGTSSDVAFAEAYTSGAISTELAEEAYAAGLKNATALPASNTPAGSSSNQIGRKGLNQSIFLGYIPASQNQSTSWALEGYINDYGLGQMAKKLSEDTSISADKRARYADEAEYLTERASNYVHAFDPNVGFFQGRNANGTWELAPGTYDPMNWGNHSYTETNGWNFAFHVPFDVDGLAALYGGSNGLKDKLHEFFTTPEPSMTSSIHEAYEQRDVRIGTWGMSNQVGHHIGYIASAAGDPTTTQEIIREVMQRLFVGSEIGQGFPGDEDNGEFSSWHLFSALGFYPLALGSGEYTIGSPLFDTVTVKRGAAHGGDLTINAANNSRDNVYIANANLDGTPLTSTQLNQEDLRDASELNFTMAGTPQTWGSRTSNEAPRVPLQDISGAKFGTASEAGGAGISGLRDDNSATVSTLPNEEATITYNVNAPGSVVKSYTITNGPAGTAAPSDWVLEASNDDETWTELDAQEDVEFAWNTQTKPFHVTASQSYTKYRLKILGSTTGAGATIAEVELLAGPDLPAELALKATQGSATVDSSATNTVAEIVGGSSLNPADYTATADFGSGPQAATVVQTDFGLSVRATNTFTATGLRNVTVSVTNNGDTKSIRSTVLVDRRGTLEAQFNNACLSIEGVGANCDSLGYAYDKAQLALPANGALVQGTEKTVTGTSLKFTLPEIENGKFDNALGEGQRIRLNLSADATKYSFIGTANENDQTGTGTVHYSDNTTDTVTITFGDWVGKATNPTAGNIVVGLIQTRLSGLGKESTNKTTALYSTAAIDIPAGKTPVWFDLPNKVGALGSGKQHYFAVADDGTTSTRKAPLALEVPDEALPTATAGNAFTAVLADIAGGFGGESATINWGDGSAVANANIASGKISGTHTFTQPGVYNVTVVVDDGVSTSALTRTLVVPGNDAATVSLTASPEDPTTLDEITLDATLPSDANGEVTFTSGSTVLGTSQVSSGVASLTIPAQEAGSYEFKATYSGDAKYRSGDVDSVSVTVSKAASTVSVAASATGVNVGGSVTLTATVAPPAATGTVTFKSGATVLGSQAVTAGTAQIELTDLAAGDLTVTAEFSGDGTYASSTSAPVTVSVGKLVPTVTLATSSTSVIEGSAVSLSAAVPADATGTVTFHEGANQVGTGAIANGVATASVTLPVGAHELTAQYAGDSRYAAGVSNVVTVTVNVDTSAGSLAVSAPAFAKKSQPYNPVAKKRVTVSAVVTGAKVGDQVVFRSGSKTLATAKVAKQGATLVATGKVAAKTPVGTYKNVTATVTSGAKSASSAKTAAFKVVKAKAKTVKLSAKKFKAGAKPKVTVKVAKLSNGRYATGKVQIRVKGKVVGTAKLTAKRKGKVTVTLKKAYRSAIKAKAKFVPKSSKTTASKSSKTLKVKLR